LALPAGGAVGSEFGEGEVSVEGAVGVGVDDAEVTVLVVVVVVVPAAADVAVEDEVVVGVEAGFGASVAAPPQATRTIEAREATERRDACFITSLTSLR